MKALSRFFGYMAIMAFNMADMCYLMKFYEIPWITAMGIGLVPCIILMNVVECLEDDGD